MNPIYKEDCESLPVITLSDNSNIFFYKNQKIKPSLNEIYDKLEKLLDLNEGWDCGNGESISKSVVVETKSLIELVVSNIEKDLIIDVLPITNGGINLLIGVSQNIVSIFINSNLTFDFEYEKGQGHQFDDIFAITNISKLKILENIIWYLSGQFQYTNTVKFLEGSPVTLSKTTMGEFQYSIGSAQ